MQIDWLTVAAQVVNFLILVWLLQRFLYKPVTRAMARREERIAERLRESREREEEAAHERARLRARLDHLEERRDAIIAQAREEADEERSRLQEEAREAAEAVRRRWEEQVQGEKERFLDELRQSAAAGFQELARRALGDLADAGLEEQMIRAFTERLRSDGGEISQALSDDTGALTVSTSFEVGPGQRRSLTRAVHEHLGTDARVEYRRDESLLCGIELRAGSRRVAWTLAGWLERFESRVEAHLEGRQGAHENGA